MKYIYKICGKVSLVFYMYVLFQLWHLCQYGGLRSHMWALLFGGMGCGITFVLWIVSKSHKQESESEKSVRKRIFRIEVCIFTAVTLFFGGRIIYSAIPYHGALSWKIDELIHKKEVKLEHNNLSESGVEGVLTDLDAALGLPEELYIANKFQLTFDESGTIQSIYAFIYGKDKKGDKKTYLIDYNAENSSNMTVFTDGSVNGEYEEDMKLSPMIELLNRAEWKDQVEKWSEKLGEEQIYELLYLGRRSFASKEGLQYIPGDADGDGNGNETRDGIFELLNMGGEIVGFEVSLHIPEFSDITPVRYIMEPEYISRKELNQENTMNQVEEAKDSEGWTVDRSDESMYFLLDDQKGWRLKVTDAAAGSRFYVMEKTVDGGTVWERINEDPFGGQLGVAQGLMFFDEKLGFAGLTGASQSGSTLYVTRDGGVSWEDITLPVDTVTELPESAESYGFTAKDYDYLHIPEKEGDTLTVKVTTEGADSDGIVFRSTDDGRTWEYGGVISQ